MEPRIFFAGMQPGQGRPSLRRRFSENAIRHLPILVFRDQLQTYLARLADAGDQIDACRLTGIQRDATANRGHRIEHRSGTSREWPVIVQCLRISGAAAATDEAHAIGLVRDRVACRARCGQEVKHPRRRLVESARTARAQDRLALVQDLGFHEQLAEGRMRSVGGRRREHDLGIARDIKHPARGSVAGEADAAQLHIIVR